MILKKENRGNLKILYAPFDFAIQKTVEEIDLEEARNRKECNNLFYFRFKNKVAKVKSKYNKQFNTIFSDSIYRKDFIALFKDVKAQRLLMTCICFGILKEDTYIPEKDKNVTNFRR